jgi:hypothetical protein
MYKTLDTLLDKTYLQKLITQQGGKCFGKENYGKVCGVEALTELKNNIKVKLYMLKPNSQQDVVYDEIYLYDNKCQMIFPLSICFVNLSQNIFCKIDEHKTQDTLKTKFD